jgi:signal transduction histidine kinase
MPGERTMAARLLKAQEDERRRIAELLHDDISQQIALLSIGVDRLRQEIAEAQPETSRRLDLVLEQAQALSLSVRTISRELYSTTLDHLGLTAALRGFCEEFGARSGIDIELRGGAPRAVPGEVALALFRIAQEALRNVARHSGASSAIVEIAATDAEVRVTIEDPGSGFDPRASAGDAPAGVGLDAMRERLAPFGGHCVIRSAPSQGTRIDAIVPLSSV